MTWDSVVTMVIVLVGVWGGFAFLIIGVLRRERRSPDNVQIIDPPAG